MARGVRQAASKSMEKVRAQLQDVDGNEDSAFEPSQEGGKESSESEEDIPIAKRNFGKSPSAGAYGTETPARVDRRKSSRIDGRSNDGKKATVPGNATGSKGGSAAEKRRKGGKGQGGGSATDDSDYVMSSEDEAADEAKVISEDEGSDEPEAKKKPARKGRGQQHQRKRKRVFVEGVTEEEMDQLEREAGMWGEDVVDTNELVKRNATLEQQEPPPDMLMPLLPFQKEWLSWSLKQEGSPFKGGILADEMGMGKTIQAISLIVTSRHRNRELLGSDCSVSKGEAVSAHTLSHCTAPCSSAKGNKPSASSAPKKLPALPQVKATLVICPLVAVIQWRQEIARFTPEGSVKVLVYHGPKRSIDVETLNTYDVVLSTYSIVESEHRKHVMPDKEECKWCGKMLYPDRLKVHLRFFCGPGAVKSAKLAKQMKKLPKKVTLSNGKKTAARKGAKIKLTEGGVDDIGEADEVLAGPSKQKGGLGRRWKKRGGILADDLNAAMEVAVEESKGVNVERGHSVLHSVRWNRIILDEAHSIKDRRCSTAKAIFALQSEYKWALSGTPLQNRVGELYSLVRFLQIDPFAYYFCKQCDCQSLDYSFGKDWRKCDHCGHSPLHHYCWWNKHVANPIKNKGFMNEGKVAMLLLKQKVLEQVLLRRTKIERAADLALPPRTRTLRRDPFDEREDDFYQALYTQSQSQFATYVESGTVLNNYAHIFDLLIRLRQAVDHPYLVVYSATAPPTSTAGAGLEAAPVADDICGICHDPAEDSLMTGCKHKFCRTCLEDYMGTAAGSVDQSPKGAQASTAKGMQCPTCQRPLTVDFNAVGLASTTTFATKGRRKSILDRINLGGFQSSTKIEALREEISTMLERDPSAKALVFSQFTSMLDLIHFRLHKCGIQCVKLDGSMSMEARDRMINNFTNDPDTKVFLMSLKAGGVALNLTVASQVFLMDPWWNPAVEQQAQDRIHRIGQYKPIQVTSFVIMNTIEERILKLQEKKQLVFEGTVGGSQEALGRLTEADMRFLFSS